MGSHSGASVLQLPVRLHGIALGRPTDLLLDLESRQVIGFVVRCRDESVRFLPYGASQPGEEEIAVQSALMLLEDVAFYAKRSVSFRSLLGGEVERDRRQVGILRDVYITRDGKVVEFELDRGGSRRRVPAAGTAVVPTRASAA